jgi:hypothetical protein
LAPLIYPNKPSIPIGSSITLNCEKLPQAKEPDRYQWYKLNIDEVSSGKGSASSLQNSRASLDLDNSVGYGPYLELYNITLENMGWYQCCLVYSKLKPAHRRLKILKILSSKEENFTNNLNFDLDAEDAPELTCSSVHITARNESSSVSKNDSKIGSGTVLKPSKSSNTFLFLSVVVVFMFVMVVLTLLTLFFYKKLKQYNNAQKATQKMCTVSV